MDTSDNKLNREDASKEVTVESDGKSLSRQKNPSNNFPAKKLLPQKLFILFFHGDHFDILCSK